MQHLSEQPLDLDTLLQATADEQCGALVVFGGVVRLHNFGLEVTHIDYSAYPPLAQKTLSEIESETRDKFGVPHCRLVHRTGRLKVGELSVLAVVRAPHRGEAFDAARYAVEALKHRVAVWKHEHYSDGSCAYMEGCTVVEHKPAAAG